MRRLLLYITAGLMTAVSLSSCSDETTETPVNPRNNGEVTLSISAAPMSGTDALSRATTEQGTEGENIKSWFVVVADKNTKEIKYIINSGVNYNNTNGNSADSTQTSRSLKLANGDYTFYGFANIPQSDILGDKTVGATLDNDFEDRTYDFEGNKPLRQKGITNAQTASELFPHGIPMTCKKDTTVDDKTSNINLDLIRMVAKIHITLRNPTTNPVYVDSILIRHITRDKVGDIKLFPNDNVDKSTGAREVNLVNYKDSAKYQQIFCYIPPTSSTTASVGGSPQNFEFYVNESHVPDEDTDKNPFEIAIARHTDNSPTNTLRYNNVDGWVSIGRNELHKLVANLDRYRIDIRVYPYTAIAVLPAYDNNTQMLTLNLAQYGHYDIVPMIRDTHNTSTYYTLYNTNTERDITSKMTLSDTDSKEQRIAYNDGYETPDLKIDSVTFKYEYSGWDDNEKERPTIGWNPTAMEPRIECITGNYNGEVDVIITAYVTIKNEAYLAKEGDKVNGQITITRRLRIINPYRNLEDLAKKRK